MEFIAAIGLDTAAVVIVVYCASAAAKKGFLRTVIQMVAYVVILSVASFISRAAAPVIYDRFVEPMMFQQYIQEKSPEEPKANAALVSAVPGSLSMLSALDDFHLEDLLPEDFDPQELTDQFISDVTDATLRPLVISGISAIAFVLLFSLLSLVANVLLSALGVINYLPVVGTFNALLGCAVGILQGLLLVWVLAILLNGIFMVYPEGWWYITPSVTQRTYLFRYFMDFDLLKQLMT